MCVAVPSRITSISGLMATIDVLGAERQASLMLLPEEAKIGEYVLVHAGFAIQKLDPDSGRETLALFEQILDHQKKQG